MAPFQETSRQISGPESEVIQWARDHIASFRHDIDTIKLQAKAILKEVDKLSKEQGNIERKSKKERSKELRGCIDKYQDSISSVQSACEKISGIVDDKTPNVPLVDRRSTYDGRGGKNRNSSSFVDQRECNLCYRKAVEIMKLQADLESMKDDMKRKEAEYNESRRRMQYENERLHSQLLKEVEAKEEALKRLSSMASSKLRDNNPNITDLSDQNRPTKIAERLSELYDNQWTDAYDVLEGSMQEGQIIQTLLGILMKVYEECCKLSSVNFYERIQNCIESPLEPRSKQPTTVILSEQLKQQIKEFRKTRAAFVIKDIERVIKPKLQEVTTRIQIPKSHLNVIQTYISHCVWIGWYCAVQDPPLVLSVSTSSKFDTTLFKDYTSRGRYVQFVVWPALYLHEGGPLLSKGVAQGCDHQLENNTVITTGIADNKIQLTKHQAQMMQEPVYSRNYGTSARHVSTFNMGNTRQTRQTGQSLESQYVNDRRRREGSRMAQTVHRPHAHTQVGHGRARNNSRQAWVVNERQSTMI
ncbi:uncharacterized protein LOC123556869 isoform X2 [Mercenaria mercenaria]|uniref:uncharacterized protein LOC123556869 isoform X2 n=1 Tax=Mercenaria mercenaria TaxID=6596 RepID=UPI00234F7F3D|nr:uncharacterized protein LOC123556869 isoform X2 [Mercenaria mercenaria]